jgi:hypothetical protein
VVARGSGCPGLYAAPSHLHATPLEGRVQTHSGAHFNWDRHEALRGPSTEGGAPHGRWTSLPVQPFISDDFSVRQAGENAVDYLAAEASNFEEIGAEKMKWSTVIQGVTALVSKVRSPSCRL